MKILMTSDTIGGVWSYALELSRALEAAGATVYLATMGEPTDDQHTEAAIIPNLKLLPGSFKLEWMENPWEDVRASGQWLLELESQIKPDIVHLNGYSHAALPWNTPALVVAHSDVVSWWIAVKGDCPPSSWNQYREHVSEGLAAADLVIAPTQSMLDSLTRNYGHLPRTRVIPNGRDASHFSSRPKENFILTAGRIWDEAKNVAAIDAVAPRLAWPVFVAGESHHPAGASREQHNLKALGRLTQRQIAEWFGRASIYALPARYEPFGLTALEAALAGCALVLGDIDSLREIWADSATFVPPDDHDALERALRQLCINPALRAAMAAKAKYRAAHFTAPKMADQYLEAYQQLTAASALSSTES